MALMINGKKVLGYALGENEYLSGNGAENLNAFYIGATQYDNVVRSNTTLSFTIDMTNYFNQADAKHPDVQYYQIMIFLDYDAGGNSVRDAFITPLLKRGEINNKRSVAAYNGQTTTAWFTDENTLTINAKSNLYNQYVFSGWFAYVHGFTFQDVGSVS